MIKCTNCDICEAKDKGYVDSIEEDTVWITFESEDDIQYQVVTKDIRCSENIQLGSIICLGHDNSMCVCENRWDEIDIEEIKLAAERMKKVLEEVLND